MGKRSLLSEEAYNEAKSLDHLRNMYSENVGEEGFDEFVDSEVKVLKTPSYRSFEEKPDGEIYFVAQRDWWNIMMEKDNSEFSEDLPGYDVSVDGTEYRVRGYLHGDDRRSLYSLEEGVKDFFSGRVSEYLDEGEVFVEENFPDILESLEGFEEMDDVTSVVPIRDSDEDATGLRRLKVRASNLIGLARNYLLKKFGDGSDVIYYENVSKTLNALDDVEMWPEALKTLRASKLPLRIEEDYMLNNRFYEYLVDTARSVYQAEYALDESDGSPVYIVSGMSHVPHITDYLRLEGRNES